VVASVRVHPRLSLVVVAAWTMARRAGAASADAALMRRRYMQSASHFLGW